ncbi:MAG TPA: M48 family metallopeptidase [Gammaproteobacteria bacterium]|nr:M48 family metallopeptidase [Gammaproteobacteria bacterium]
MTKLWIVIASALLLCACATSPTGTPQLSFFPESQLAQMGAATYQKEKQELPVAKNPAVRSYVQCVAQHVTAVAGSPANWEVTVFQKDVANAWALPGGYIGVYTGLLDYARDQAQLAAVLGHEVSHVLAHHANARLSTAYATQAGLQVTQALLNEKGGGQNSLIMAALGLGAQVGILLPYSRSQESEADVLGLKLMARAGFDPREAIQLWQNMAKAGGSAPPAFLSDHPANEARIHDLSEHMDEAMALFKQARAAGRHPNCQAPS